MLDDFSIYLITWNVVGRPPIEDLGNVMGIHDNVEASCLPDIYAIGLQEVTTKPQAMLLGMLFEDPWCKAFREILAKWDYVKIKTVRLRGLMLLVFTKRKHLTHLHSVQTDFTRTGLGGVWGNKGGVTVRLNAYGCSICIVNCHLAAHDHELKQRIDDYNSILDNQVFADPETENILYHDYVFWIGDLNFRISEHSAEEVKSLIDKGEFETLLEKDQLREVMKSGEAFSEFTETAPTFKPSYKYFIDSDDYDLRRKPGWTDRILYKVNPDVYENITLKLEQKNYKIHQSYSQSDHKPVTSQFVVKVFSAYSYKKVNFSSIDVWYIEDDNHLCKYMMDSDLDSTPWDWIGLFRVDFSSLDDYVTYVWAAPKSDQNDQQQSTTALLQVTFPEINATPGEYCLLYLGGEFGDVLGISEPFKVANK